MGRIYLGHVLNRHYGDLTGPYLFCIFAHVRVDLAEGAHGVELIHVHTGLFCQICVHILITDHRHLTNVGVISVEERREAETAQVI